MIWSVAVHKSGESTPIFIDLPSSFDEVVLCIDRIGKCFGGNDYCLAFLTPESATLKQIDALRRYGAVSAQSTDRQ